MDASLRNPLNDSIAGVDADAERREAVSRLPYALHSRNESVSSIFSWSDFRAAMDALPIEESFYYPDDVVNGTIPPLAKVSTKRRLAQLSTVQSSDDEDDESEASSWFGSCVASGGRCHSCISHEDENDMIRLSPVSFERIRNQAVSPVLLNVYHVGNKKSVSRLNAVTRDFLHMGGLFHTAIEVCGIEWSFGFCEEDRSGVFCCFPRQCPVHTYRESVYMGDCGFDAVKIKAKLKAIRHDWMGPDYDLLRKNCNNFTTAFLNDLGLGDIPRWCNRLARLGIRLSIRSDIAHALRSLSHLDFRFRGHTKDDSTDDDAHLVADDETELLIKQNNDLTTNGMPLNTEQDSNHLPGKMRSSRNGEVV